MGNNFTSQKARALYSQFNNLVEVLSRDHLAIINTNLVIKEDKDSTQLTWQSNGKENKYSAEKEFLNIKQYLEIFDQRMFHIMLFDCSIVRFNYVFEGHELKSQNLLWWPCPLNLSEFYDIENIDKLIDTLNGKFNASEIIMRSPLRIDYDSKNATETHPINHIHIENPQTRIAVNEPLCIYGFMEFIFKNFYPKLKFNYEWEKMPLIDQDLKLGFVPKLCLK